MNFLGKRGSVSLEISQLSKKQKKEPFLTENAELTDEQTDRQTDSDERTL